MAAKKGKKEPDPLEKVSSELARFWGHFYNRPIKYAHNSYIVTFIFWAIVITIMILANRGCSALINHINYTYPGGF